jgi:biopolymer transport protein ExbB/TolQ
MPTDVELRTESAAVNSEAVAVGKSRRRSGEAPLSWSAGDPEAMLGLRGRRFTQVSSLLALLIGLVFSAIFYGVVALAPTSLMYAMFYQRGVTPPFIVAASFWCLAILLLKRAKLGVQRSALSRSVVPDDADYVISPGTAQRVLVEVHRTVDDAKNFVLFNRIVAALSILKNLGRVSDVDEVLRGQAEQDESAVETSYGLVRGLIWAIPTLGFIGTVLGLSEAIGGFGAVMGSAEDVSVLTESLRGVTQGLSTAFDTTLEALVAAVFLHGFYTLLYKAELEFLDDCAEYCQRHIVTRLRITPFDAVEA